MPRDRSPKETATEGGKTLDDLVSALREALKDPEDLDLLGADFWIDDLQRAAEGGWGKAMQWSLDEVSVVGLAGLLTDEIAYELQAGPGESYYDTLKRGHALLQLLHTKATELGIDIPIEQVDVPLRPAVTKRRGSSVRLVRGGRGRQDPSDGRGACNSA